MDDSALATIRENTAKLLRDRLSSARLNLRSPWQWALAERWVGRGASPLTQYEALPYRAFAFPWCEEPTETANDPSVEMTVLWMGSALGKSDAISGSVIGWHMSERPTNIQSIWPIETQRDKFSRDVIQVGLIDATPCLRETVVEKKSREAGNTIALKQFVAGSLYMLGGGSVNSFRGQRIGFTHMAEVDSFAANIGDEGDPVLLAKTRMEGFRGAFFVEGTGTLTPFFDATGQKVFRSRIHYWYSQSDQRKWLCPCRACGERQVLIYRQIRYPAGKPQKAEYFCAACDAGHNEQQRQRMVRDGKWFPTATENELTAPDYETGFICGTNSPLLRDVGEVRQFDGTAGFWLSGFNSLLPPARGSKTKLHQFVRDFERAQKGMDPQFSKRVWVNTIACGLNNPEGESEPLPEWKPLFDRRENYGDIVPSGGLYLSAFGDVQVNRIEVGWEAWGRNEESWGLAHVVIDGNTKESLVWDSLARELGRTWKHESGATMRLGMCFVDGGWAAEWVYAFLRRLALNPVDGVTGHVRASKGIGEHGHPIIDPRYRTVAKQLKGYHVGTWEAKDLVNQRLRLTDKESVGFMHFNQSYGEEYFRQLCTGKVTIIFERGQEIRKYLNAEHLKDEALDITVGNLAAFRLRPRNFDQLERDLAATIPQKGEQKTDEPPEEFELRSSGWMKL